MVIKWDEMVFVKKVRNRLLLFPRRPSFISSNTSGPATRQLHGHIHIQNMFLIISISMLYAFHAIHLLIMEYFPL